MLLSKGFLLKLSEKSLQLRMLPVYTKPSGMESREAESKDFRAHWHPPGRGMVLTQPVSGTYPAGP